MKTDSPTYTDPTPKQVKGLCATMCSVLPLPSKGLTQLWIEQPALLCARLDTINYRPARCSCWMMPPHIGVSDTIIKVVMRLESEGLITDSLYERLAEKADDLDILIIRASLEPGKSAVEKYAKKGVAVIAIIIEEDVAIFSGKENVYVFAGKPFSDFELECFIRDVLFRIRGKLYCGKKD